MPDPRPADRIKARTDADAKRRYLDFLQKSLSAVHSKAIWRIAPVPGTDQWSAFTAPDPTLRLRTSSGDWLYLRATQRFHYADHPDYPGERKVVTDDYAYTLSEDDAGTELFSWQWHPGLWSDPHVHVGRGHPDHGGLAKLHIPTGRIAFEEVLKFAIIEYDLITPVDRDTALAQLDETLRRFRAFRQWH